MFSLGKKRVEMEKKRGPQKKSKKKKKAPEKGGMKAEERELPLGEDIKGAAGSGAEEGQSDNDEEEEERENTDGPSVTGNGPSFLLSSLAVSSASSRFCASSAVFEMSLRLSGCHLMNNLYHWGHRLVQREQCGHTWH